LTYQWNFNYTDIPGANGPSLTLTSVTPAQAGWYGVTVDNGCGWDSGGVWITVPGLPVITTPPQSQTVIPASAAQFSVAVSGATPFAYQWYRNGTAISGATQSTLSLVSVQPGDLGDYTVVVRNAAGQVTSSAARLAVATPDTDADGMPDAWELVQGFDPAVAADATADADGDGLSNRDEFRAGTNPHNSHSVLSIQYEYDSLRHILHIKFYSEAGFDYTVLYKESVTTPWQTLVSIPARTTSALQDVSAQNNLQNNRIFIVQAMPARRLSMPGDGRPLSFMALAGYVYELEYSDNLTTWQPLRWVYVATTQTVSVTDPNPPPARFYRLRRLE
jgi:hypothetical protein